MEEEQKAKETLIQKIEELRERRATNAAIFNHLCEAIKDEAELDNMVKEIIADLE